MDAANCHPVDSNAGTLGHDTPVGATPDAGDPSEDCASSVVWTLVVVHNPVDESAKTRIVNIIPIGARFDKIGRGARFAPGTPLYKVCHET